MSDVIVFNAPAPLGVEEIRRRVAGLLEQRGAVKAILIGSYARGTADAWSDVDLIVVMPTEKSFVERPLELTNVLDALPVAVDLLVYTPEEFERGMRDGRAIFAAIADEGVTLL